MRSLASLSVLAFALLGIPSLAWAQSSPGTWVGSTQHWTVTGNGLQTEMAMGSPPSVTSLWGRAKTGSGFDVDVDVTQTAVQSPAITDDFFGVQLELLGVENGAWEAVLEPASASGPTTATLHLRRQPGGVPLASATVPMTVGTPMHWSVSVTQNRVQIAIDGTPRIDHTGTAVFTGRVGPISYATPCRMSAWSWSAPAIIWTGTSGWDLSGSGMHPQISGNPAQASLLTTTGYGTDFTAEANVTQTAAGGSFYGFQIQGASASYEVMMGAAPDAAQAARNILVRRIIGSQTVVLAHGPPVVQQVGFPARWRVVATSDRLRVFVNGVLELDVPGTGDFTGLVGPITYGTNARFDFETGGWDRPSSIADCQDLRPASTTPWWFPGASSASLAWRLRDAATASRPFNMTSTVRHGTTTTATGTHSFSPVPRTWTTVHVDATLGTQALYWVEMKNSARTYGDWPVARHAMPAPNTFPATNFAMGVRYQDFGLIDQTARNTYAHALGNASVRDGVNAIYGIEPQDVAELDILNTYGVKAVIIPPLRTSAALMNHAAVLAYQISDHPTTQAEIDKIDAICDAYKTQLGAARPCVTAMDAEDSAKQDYHKWWRDLGAELRAFSYFPYRNTGYTLLNSAPYLGHVGGPSTLAWLNAGLSTPWYFIAQAHGSSGSPLDPLLRSPLPREVSAQVVLAAVHGAKGVFNYSYAEDNPAYVPLLNQRTLLAADPGGRLGDMTATYTALRAWWTRGTLVQASRPVRRAGAVLPYWVHTRQLSDGTLVFINLDAVEHCSIRRAFAPDLSPATAYEGLATAQWSPDVIGFAPGTMAFAVTSDPTLWHTDTTSDYQHTLQTLVDSVTPAEGDFPNHVVLDPISPHVNAWWNGTQWADAWWTGDQWFHTITKDYPSGDGIMSPLALFRLMEGRNPVSWTLQANGAVSTPLPAALWRAAQLAYAHGARNVHDANSSQIKFGPYNATNAPPSNQAVADLIALGTPGGEFRVIGPNYMHHVAIGRKHNGKQYVMLISLLTTHMNFYFGSKIPATQARDVYTGTTIPVTLTNGVYTAPISVPGNNMRLLEWVCTDPACSVCGDGIVSGPELCDPERDRGCRSDCTGPITNAATELSCRDTADNDSDGLVDCTDLGDCATSLDCMAVPSCANGLTCAVCGDGAVSGGELCEPGLDPGCRSDCTGPIINAATELSCRDAADNDGDGLVDCADVTDCNADSACRVDEGQTCTKSYDCEKGLVCISASCRKPHCDNGVKDPDEVGIDCGGECPFCTGRSCDNVCRVGGLTTAAAQETLLFSTGQFSRPSTATSLGANGVLEVARANELRWVRPSGQTLALFEGASSNKLSWSAAVDHSPEWSSLGASTMLLAANASTAPDGAMAAELLLSPDGPARSPGQTATLTPGPSTLSVWLSSASADADGFEQTRAFVASASGVLGMQSWQLLHDWQRQDLTVDVAQNVAATVALSDLAGWPESSVQASFSPPLYGWGAQLEAQPFPTSYIPTQAGVGNRAADVLTFTNPPAWLATGLWQLDVAPLFSSSEMRADTRYTLVSFASGGDIALLRSASEQDPRLVLRYGSATFTTDALRWERGSVLQLIFDCSGDRIEIHGPEIGGGTASVPSLAFPSGALRIGGAWNAQSEAFSAISEPRRIAANAQSCTTDPSCSCGNSVLEALEICDPSLTANCDATCSSTALAPCDSDADCPTGSVCGQNSRRFRPSIPGNVCWPALCEQTADQNCGPGAPCGECVCTPSCSAAACGTAVSDGCGGTCIGSCDIGQGGCRDSRECPVGYSCGHRAGPSFGLAANVNVCWPDLCDEPRQRAAECGPAGALCGTCPSWPAECGDRECGSDEHGNACGTCPTGLQCTSAGHCLELLADIQPPVPGVASALSEPSADPVGTLKGSFAVDANGAATYSIPLDAPPGRAGLTPQLSLEYTSSAGDGFVGRGWSLGGLSTITRCPHTYAQHGYASGVELTEEDAFCLDGKLLVSTGTSEYRTELDSFARIRSAGSEFVGSGASAKYVGPEHFKVWTKDGKILTYGQHEESRIEAAFVSSATDPEFPVRVNWLLDAIEDADGNTISIRYRRFSRDQVMRPQLGALAADVLTYTAEVQPTHIFYGASRSHVIEIEYAEDQPNWAVRTYRSGVGRHYSSPITTVSAKIDDELVRVYRFDSEVHDGQWYLRSVRSCAFGDAGERCLPATTFDYTPINQTLTKIATTEDDAGSIPISVRYGHSGYTFEPENVNNWQIASLDVDGDGKQDIMHSRFEGLGDFAKITNEVDYPDPPYMYARRSYGSIETIPLAGSAYTIAFSGIDTNERSCPLDKVIQADGDGRDDYLALCPSGRTERHGSVPSIVRRNADGSLQTRFVRELLPAPPAGMHRTSETAVGDFNGDGLVDVVSASMNDDNEVFLTLHVGSPQGFASSSAPLAIPGSLRWIADPKCFLSFLGCLPTGRPMVLDIDGDGVDELLLQQDETLAAVSSGPEGTLRVRELGKTPFNSNFTDNYEFSTRFSRSFVLDANGDGMQDIVLGALKNSQWHAELYLSTGRGFVYSTRSPGSIPVVTSDGPFGNRDLWSKGFVVDLDSDGRDELLVPNLDGTWTAHTPYSHESAASNTWVTATAPLPFYWGHLHWNPRVGKSKTKDVYGFQAPFAFDWDGDGTAEVLTRQARPGSAHGVTNPVFELWKAGPRTQGLLQVVTDGLGKRTTIAYDSGRSYRSINPAAQDPVGYVQGDGCQYPQKCLGVLPNPIVVGHMVSAGAGNFSQQLGNQSVQSVFEYRYRDARADLRGRGWLGFRERDVREFGAAAKLLRKTTYQYDLDTQSSEANMFALAGYPKSVETIVTTGSTTPDFLGLSTPLVTHKTRVDNIWTVQTQATRPFVALSSRTTKFLEVGTDSVEHRVGEHGEAFTYDDYGNRTGYVSVWSDGRSLANIARYDTSPELVEKWLVGLPKVVLVYGIPVANGDVSKGYALSFQYEGEHGRNGHATQIQRGIMVGEGFVPRQTISLDYDSFGNETSRSISGTDAVTQSNSIVYDSRGLWPEQSHNGVHDAAGLPFTRLGVDPRTGANQWTIRPDGSWTVVNRDGFGRTVQVRESSGEGTDTRYLSGGTAGGALRVVTSGRGTPTTEQEFSQGGLLIADRTTERSPDAQSPQTREVVYAYDPRGLLHARSRVHLVNENFGEPADLYTYDELERVTLELHRYDAAAGVQLNYQRHTYWSSELRPAGEESSVTWGEAVWAHRISDPLFPERTKVSTTNLRGKTIEAIDPLGSSTRFTRGAFDYVEGVVAAGAFTEYHTDEIGQITYIDTPDQEVQTFGYDGLGLLRVHTRDGAASIFGYDGLGRRRSALTLDGAYTWDYDGNGTVPSLVGNLQRESLASVRLGNSSTSYEYGNPGAKVSAIHRTIDGEEFHTLVENDDLGRTHVVRYPGDNSFGVLFGYEGAFGRLNTVREEATGSLLWRLDAIDQFGNASEVVQGNGLSTSKAYGTYSGLLRSISVETDSGAQVLSQALEYDRRGLVESRLTNRPGQSTAETFEYDAMKRLRFHRKDGIEDEYTYDLNGNLRQTPERTLFYEGTGPHQVTRASTGEHYEYVDGNQTLRQGGSVAGEDQIVSYSQFDLPYRVVTRPLAGPGRDTRIRYDAAGQRVGKSEVDGPSTVYVGDLYERTTSPSGATKRVARVPTPDGMTIEASLGSSAAPEYRYLHTDHLGSTIAVTGQGQASLEERSYRPFGAATATGSSVGSTRYGFTAQELDAELGLLNMRGRMYDPAIGRFLSADPNVQAPNNSQSWNPYTYAFNSPLNAIDPSGFIAQGTAAESGYQNPLPAAPPEPKKPPEATEGQNVAPTPSPTSVVSAKPAQAINSGAATPIRSILPPAMPSIDFGGFMANATGFAIGAIQGAVVGSLSTFGLGYAAGATALALEGLGLAAAASVAAPAVVAAGTAVMVGWAVHGLVNGGAQQIADSVGRIAGGGGDASDWQLVGTIFGGGLAGVRSAAMLEGGMSAAAADAASAEVLGIVSGGGAAKAANASTTSGETAATAAGRLAHKNWKPPSGFDKEVRLPSGKRVDALNRTTREVIELKPNNPRAIRTGQKQVDGYVQELNQTTTGQPWTGRVETY